MKKIYLGAALLAFSLVACDFPKEQNAAQAEMVDSSDSLQRVIQQKDNELNNIMSTLNEIQEGFRQINEAEGRVCIESVSGEGSKHKIIMENMAFIQRTMKNNRELIANLKQQLRNTTSTNSKLKATIEETLAGLMVQMEEKNAKITALKEELAQKETRLAEQGDSITALTIDVAELSSDNAEKQITMAKQEIEINTAWYALGTKKELRAQKILKDGDVLRTGDFNKNYFTRIDLRETTMIPLKSKSAKLLTNHPAGSYALEKDSEGEYVLHIYNPQTFWSVSRYLVVSVK